MATIETENRYNDGTWAIRLVHFNRGWRYWAFLISEGAAVNGLSPDGYDTMKEARAALGSVRCSWALTTAERCTNPATNGDVCAYCEDARDKRRD